MSIASRNMIVELLKQKNRALLYKEIYEELEEAFSLDNNDPQAAIRREIERACSDYKAYEGKADIFYKEGELRNAKIGLREWLSTEHKKYGNLLKEKNTSLNQIGYSEAKNKKIKKIDWKKISEKIKDIGDAGELIVSEMEKKELRNKGCYNLSLQVIHVSKEQGDGAGYDILSFFPNGKQKYIEVKTSIISDKDPFFISRNELLFLEEHVKQAFVYRVFIDQKLKKYNVEQYTATDILNFRKEPTQFKVFID